MGQFITYMWQECYGIPEFRFQTNDPFVIKRMHQRKDFQLIGYSLTCRLKIFKASFYSPKEARRTLARVTRARVLKDAQEGFFYTETGAIVDRSL